MGRNPSHMVGIREGSEAILNKTYSHLDTPKQISEKRPRAYSVNSRQLTTGYRLPSTGFTLIELLVVISVIAVLIAILIPSLRKAREAGRRIACLGHLRQLQIAWYSYAVDNDDNLVNAQPYYTGFGLGYNGKPWLIDGAGLNSSMLQTPLAAEKLMESGALAPYVGDVQLYMCPGRYRFDGQGTHYGFQWLSSYQIVAAMNGFSPEEWEEFELKLRKKYEIGNRVLHIRRLSDMTRRSPSKRMVFVDTGWGGNFTWSSDGLWGFGFEDLDIYGKGIGHTVFLPIHHSQGTCFSFADGHGEYWKWTESNTMIWTQWFVDNYYRIGNIPKPEVKLPHKGNPDYKRVHQAVWDWTDVRYIDLE